MTTAIPKGDTARFERCFASNYADVARFCARRAPTPQDAEDAAVEVFAVAWRRLRDMPDEPDDRLWLFGVARGVLANAARAERRRAGLLVRLAAHVPSPVPPPGAGHEAAELAAALSELPAGDRELLLLSGWEDLRPAEIARLVGRPAPVVSRRLHRARRRLAAALASQRSSLQRGTPPITEGNPT